MNDPSAISQAKTKASCREYNTLQAAFKDAHQEATDWTPAEQEYLSRNESSDTSRPTDSTVPLRKHQPKNHMHANHLPQSDDVNSGLLLRNNHEQRPSSHSIHGAEKIPFFGLVFTIPFMILLGEPSFFIAGAVFLIAIIRMIYAGFKITPVWGILNVCGFYFPILWLAYGILNWHRAKREFLFAAAAAGCIFYLHQIKGLSL